MPKGSLEFLSGEDASISPLAQKILALKEVERVFYGQNYISVSL